MNISNNGLALIKKYEGCRLTAYKDSVGVWTIGYGTTNADKAITGLTIKSGTTITKAQAEAFLETSVNRKYVPLVNKYDSIYHWNQNQLDALTSFAYNIGSIDQLTNKGKRTIAEISAKIPAYNKAGGKVLTGLVRRRAEEKSLFDSKVATTNTSINTELSKNPYYPKYIGTSNSLVDALKSVGVSNTTFANRKTIAKTNMITNYLGTASQNIKMLELLKKGELKRA